MSDDTHDPEIATDRSEYGDSSDAEDSDTGGSGGENVEGAGSRVETGSNDDSDGAKSVGETAAGPADREEQAGQANVHPDLSNGEAVLEDVKAYFEEASDLPFDPPDTQMIEENFFDFGYLDRAEEIERYWVNEPYAYVSILYDDRRKEHRYRVVEPELDTFERYVRGDLVTLLRNSLMYIDYDEDDEGEREDVFVAKAKGLIKEHAATVAPGTLHKVLYYLLRDFVHYGKIDPIMRDRNIEDISCDGADVPVFVYHREYRDLPTNVQYGDRELTSFAVRLAQRAGRQLSVSDPLVDASLPEGSRIQLTQGGDDVATRGSNFTIRKFADIPYTPVDLINWNTFSLEQMAYFWLAIENNKSLIFAGGTGSGKTTSMNAVSFFIPPMSKVVTIEDTREIDLPHQNWIASVTRSSASGEGRGEVTMYNLLQAALRQRPEYIVVGEIRTEQRVALTFFQAMGTGHTAYTTVHADSVDTVLSRLQNPPLNVPAQMLQDLDVVSIQRQAFLGDRRVRRNSAVWELAADEDNPNEIATNEIYEWDPSTDTHTQVGESSVLGEIAHDRGWDEETLQHQIREREAVLEYLLENEYFRYEDVAATVHTFQKDPEYVLDLVERGELDPAEFDVTLGESVEAEAEMHDLVTTDGPADGSADGPTAAVTAPDPSSAATWEQIVSEAEMQAQQGIEGIGDGEFDAEGESTADETSDDAAEEP